MIHVVTAANRHLYEDKIEEHFRIRHEMFVVERGWKTLERADGREMDAFDNEDTVYLMAIEGDHILGGNRLYPTVKPTILSEVFPHLAAVRGVPSDPLIWEWSRFFIVKERRDGKLAFELLAALQEFCLDEGIEQMSGVFETWWLPRFHEAGMTVIPLGLPDIVEGAWTMAGRSPVSTQTLDHIRVLGKIPGPVLVRRGPRQPVVEQALNVQRFARAKAS